MTLTRRILKAATVIRRHEHGIHAESLDQLRAFAAAVVARRAELGITRRQLSERVHISYGQLSHIENAENWPTAPVMMAIIKRLNMGRQFLALVRALKCGKPPLL